jgi:hypothetical protein
MYVVGVLAVMATEETVFAPVGCAALKDTEHCGGSVTKPFLGCVCMLLQFSVQ